MRSLTPVAALAAAAVLVTTGCAGASATSSPSVGGAASLVPADSVAFLAVDTNLSSAQWHALDGLLAKFPAHDALLAKLQQTFERRTKLSWAADVQPALGPEVDLVALPGSPPQHVVLTQPHDPAKLHALLARAGAGLVSRTVGGWTAISKSADALASLGHVTATLAGSTAYESAMAQLSGDALVRAYVDGAYAQRALSAVPGQVTATRTPVPTRSFGASKNVRAFAPERFAWGAAELEAVHDGLRLEAFTRAAPATRQSAGNALLLQLRTSPYTSFLVDEIPADALLVADWQAGPTGFEDAPASQLPPWLQALRATSPTLLQDLEGVLGGETALYVRPGLPLPEVTLVTQPAETDQAVASLPQVLDELKAAIPMLAQVTVHHAVVGGQLVLSTSEQGIASFLASGPKLGDDSTFQAATKAAGMPQQTTGFVYANLQDALPLVGSALKLGDLGALHALVAYGARDGAQSSYTAFLDVQ
jgi:hypothetical protein